MIEQTEDGLRVTAPMIIANAHTLLDAGRHVLRSAAQAQAVVDLTGVSEVDSSALSVVFAWQRDALERGASLRISHPPASMISLAALYGVSELLPLA